MQWQDLVFTIGQIIFIISLIPSIISKDKPALATSVITAIVLFVFAYVDFSLSLYFASVAVAATGVGWTVLAYQKYIIDRRKV